MKNLKIKFGFFSLLAILAASVFLTSCEQETLLDDITLEHAIAEETIELDESFQLILPNGMSEAAIVEWLDNSDYDELKEIAETTDMDEVEVRNCGSWSSWTHYYTDVSCFTCSSQRSQHTYYYYRLRTCGSDVELQIGTNSSCKNYC